MAASVSAVATALMASLSGISGLRTKNYQPEDLSVAPIAYPTIQTVTYHRAFGGGDVVMDWNVEVVTGRWTDRTAHALLDSYLSYDGASSIRAALEADVSLGGVVQTMIVQSSTSISSVSQGEQEFLGITFQVTVHA
jgi:hypothetical protein